MGRWGPPGTEEAKHSVWGFDLERLNPPYRDTEKSAPPGSQDLLWPPTTQPVMVTGTPAAMRPANQRML